MDDKISPASSSLSNIEGLNNFKFFKLTTKYPYIRQKIQLKCIISHLLHDFEWTIPNGFKILFSWTL